VKNYVKTRMVASVLWLLGVAVVGYLSSVNPHKVYAVSPSLVNPFCWGLQVALILLIFPAMPVFALFLVQNVRARESRMWLRVLASLLVLCLAFCDLILIIGSARAGAPFTFSDFRTKVEVAERFGRLHKAIVNDDTEAVRQVVDRYPELINTRLHKAGATPFRLASMRGQTDFVRIMLEHGLPTNDSDICGMSSLHWAAANGHAQTVELLAQAGLALDKKDNQGSTPLHHAAMLGRLDVTKVLVEAGAEVNASNDYKLTPRMLASEKGHDEISAFLGARGAEDKGMELQRAMLRSVVELGKVLGDSEHTSPAKAKEGMGMGMGMFGEPRRESQKKPDEKAAQ